jgi:hypothetical protein
MIGVSHLRAPEWQGRLAVAVIAIGVGLLSGGGNALTAASVTAQPARATRELTDLEDLQQFRTAFDGVRQYTRVVLLLSPT